MKFAIRRVLILALGFHVLAFMYVVEILKKRGERELVHLLPDKVKRVDVADEDPTAVYNHSVTTSAPLPQVTVESHVDSTRILAKRIEGLETILKPAVDALNEHYLSHSKDAVDAYSWKDITLGRNRIHGHEYAMLQVLQQEFPHIDTIPLVADVDDLEQYLLPYYYHYSSNNCSSSPFGLKRESNVLKWMYNASCKPYIVDTLKPVPFKFRTRGLRIWNYAGYLKDPSKILVTYLAIAPHALVDKYGDVTTHNVTLVPERCDSSKGWDPSSFHADQVPGYKAVFSIHQKYGRDATHNNLEDLTRLAPYVPFVRDNPAIMVHSSYSNILLELLTISLKRVVPETVRSDIVYQPAGTHCSLPSMFNTQLMSYYVRNGLHNEPATREVILMIRPPKMLRNQTDFYDKLLARVKQEASVIQSSLLVLEFTDINSHGMALTRELFNKALIVIAIRSTPALSNLYFSQPGTVLIEGHCPDASNVPTSLSYAAFAQVLALRYYAVLQGNSCMSPEVSDDFAKPIRFYMKNLKAFQNDALYACMSFTIVQIGCKWHNYMYSETPGLSLPIWCTGI
ncbi:hypothetical protein CAPTEDRAFT_208470 [Capitella teleta]|uniref:Uncharacterized protein n=1 Tax=Capitella teleta TaxID=283909 RepID=R7V2G1_CAPTE|nr:hypothetical protein CAPTEDRAFT_208470 [Capitella teleta]|eukprot:ELU12699.1 hypothetical protein CAPTEDRAFT_208470 [Capitella teleta]